jgi:hypothetical protein
MACITLLAAQISMATTQFARVIGCEISAPWQKQHAARQPLRMNWVVVTGKDGRPSLRMRWVADGNC